jgi:hypothetical protein
MTTRPVGQGNPYSIYVDAGEDSLRFNLKDSRPSSSPSGGSPSGPGPVVPPEISEALARCPRVPVTVDPNKPLDGAPLNLEELNRLCPKPGPRPTPRPMDAGCTPPRVPR